ncbi:hypothetical protein OF83DRAFT_1092508 [Amylostereum chailletii]|nr:hypothetical protein OF83DRAFT_1092508 [Amylostereum chailletii]
MTTMAKSCSTSHIPAPLSENDLRRMDISKRRADRMTDQQLSILLKHFGENSRPSMNQRRTIAKEIGRDVSKVSNWFGNQRREPRRLASKKSRQCVVWKRNNEPSSSDSDLSGMDTDAELVSCTPSVDSVNVCFKKPPLSLSPPPPSSITFLCSVDLDVLIGAILLHNLRYPNIEMPR